MKTEQDCQSLNADEVLQQTAWGENLVSFDEDVVIKANVTCWHTAALGYAAKNNWLNATSCCNEINYVSTDSGDANMLYREYVLCIDAVATRLREPFICEKITSSDFEFEKARCIRHATPPPQICSATPVVFIVFCCSLFIFRKNRQ